MALIEGIGDDVITLVFILFSIIIIIMSWLSTNVREFAFPANLLVIERRSRRLYTTNNINGNLNIIGSHQLSTTRITTNPQNISLNNQNNFESTIISGNESLLSENRNNNQSSNAVRVLNSSNRTSNSQNLDLVNEMVEQALLDNLLDGQFYTTHDLNLLNHTTNNHSLTSNESFGINSGNGQAISSMNATTTANTSTVYNSIIENDNSQTTGDENRSLNESIDTSTNEELINILVKFVDEKEMKIQVGSNDTILLIKKTYFSQELSNNKIVRFIYQGQFLSDKNTIKSYNIKNHTTIHCHITSKKFNQQEQQQEQQNVYSETNEIDRSSNLHQRLLNNQNNQMDLTETDVNNNNQERNESNSSNDTSNSNSNRNEQTFSAVINIDLNNLLLPIIAIILGTCWYFRINFKHLFSPLSTLILIIFSFLYAILFFNYIHSTSSYFFTNNFLLNNRLLQRHREPEQQTQD